MILMKDKRAIIIKSPKLQKIRNNLRDLLFQAARLKRKGVRDKGESLFFEDDGSHKSLYDLSPSELRLFRDLQNHESSITDMINRSILSCVMCGKGERDMVYNKTYDAWYCTECYGLERLNAQEQAKLKAIKSHSKTFL